MPANGREHEALLFRKPMYYALRTAKGGSWRRPNRGR
jgi:hypothetical protein